MEEDVTRWFSSDLHLSHENIITYCKRPFANVREMDESLIVFHNELVKPEDHWTCLGDVTMKRGGKQEKEWFIRTVKRFNGHKRLFLGNHDHFPIQTYIDAGFEKIYATWRDDDGLLYSHIPIHPKSFSSARANIHGHIHEAKAYPPFHVTDEHGARVVTKPYINLSVEATNYRPVDHDQVKHLVQQAKSEWEGIKI